jgi:hypothetical protein
MSPLGALARGVNRAPEGRYRAFAASGSGNERLWLSERECVRLGAGLEDGDLERPLADSVVLAHELVQVAVSEQPVPVLVDVDAV